MRSQNVFVQQMREFYGKGEKPVAESGKEKRITFLNACSVEWATTAPITTRRRPTKRLAEVPQSPSLVHKKEKKGPLERKNPDVPFDSSLPPLYCISISLLKTIFQ